jgi:ribosome-binding protein aMBF1 (putative translation factor)
MIRTESEYRHTVKQAEEVEQQLREQKSALRSDGRSPTEIKRLLDAQRTYCAQLQEEIDEYERLKRGELQCCELQSLDELGLLLIRLRIASGLSQKELADRLSVHESQVSRDERNEYHGITLERASRTLRAMGVDLRSDVSFPPTMTAT